MDMKSIWKAYWPWLLDLAAMLLAGWLMLGCSSKRVVQSNRRSVHDTVYVSRGVRDSVRVIMLHRDSVCVRVRDSVVIVRDTSGKVVARYEWHFGDRTRDKSVGRDKVRIKTDTLLVYRNKTDTLTVLKTVTAPTKKHKSRLAVVLCVLALLVAAGIWIKLRSDKFIG